MNIKKFIIKWLNDRIESAIIKAIEDVEASQDYDELLTEQRYHVEEALDDLMERSIETVFEKY